MDSGKGLGLVSSSNTVTTLAMSLSVGKGLKTRVTKTRFLALLTLEKHVIITNGPALCTISWLSTALGCVVCDILVTKAIGNF